MKQNLLIFAHPVYRKRIIFFTNSIIFCLKNGKSLYHVYLSLPVPCTPIIINCQIPSTGTIYGWPEISLHLMNSPIIASFKFSITSPFPNPHHHRRSNRNVIAFPHLAGPILIFILGTALLITCIENLLTKTSR